MCSGKGIVIESVPIPGKFTVGVVLNIDFDIAWTDSSDATVPEVERDIREILSRKNIIQILEDETNGSIRKVEFSARVAAEKL